jgi:hypothetical protein
MGKKLYRRSRKITPNHNRRKKGQNKNGRYIEIENRRTLLK